MKHTFYFKRTTWACLLCAVLLYACKTHYPVAKENYTLIKTPNSFDRGKNLVYNTCGGCHYNRGVGKFVGNKFDGIPKVMGKVYTANLTNSKEYGIMRLYTDAQLAYLLKTGITRDGHFIPYMVRPTMADDDINDIIVYLRSDDAAVAAGDTSVGKTHLNAIGRAAIHSKKPEPYITPISRPEADNAVANGRYLVDIIGCYHCHSKSITSLNYLHAEQSKGYMQGGEKFKGPDGKKIYASNLTPCKTTGIGYYTREDFRKAVREGQAPNRKLHPPMEQFHHLTDKQTDDIYAYLQTLPRAHHKIKGHAETAQGAGN